MKVKDIMYTHLFTIPFDKTVEEAAQLMDKKDIGSLIVEKNGEKVGIITEWDVVRKVTATGKNPNELTVDEVKSYPLIMVDSNFDILEAAQLMKRHDIRRLVVIDKGKIVGILSANTICNNLASLIT